MIHLTDLQFQYPMGPFALSIPDLRVQDGATLAVTGPSGSGKTTLLHLIAGVLVPKRGCVVTNRIEVSSLSESARRDFRIRHIGLVFQEFELLEHLNVLDNILLPCRITASIPLRPEHRDRAIWLAREMGIADKLRRYVRKLSQGERQRVALCRALLLEPPLLLCDEPTGNLDPANREHVLDILLDYVRRHETTMLTVTHDHQILSRFDKTLDFQSFQERHDV
jgi:putative ABC transport system ATP-binding protein